MVTESAFGVENSWTTTASTVAADNFAEKLPACPLCSGLSFRKLPTPGHWIGEDIFSCGAGTFGLCRCHNCSLVFVNPRPTQTLLNAFYGGENYVCHSPDAGGGSTARFLLERVARYGPSHDKQFLDFGCGGGFLLRAALDAGWNAFGHDIGKRALASCKAQGLNVTDDLGQLGSGRFDVVFLNHVFEHVAEPQDLLSSCRQLLTRDGKLFIAVPNLAGLRAQLSFRFLSRHFNIDERHRAFPIHLFYYTPRTLVKVLEKSGLRVIGVETFGLGMDEFVNQPDAGTSGSRAEVSPKRTSGGKALRQIIKKAFFGARLGENLLVIAQSM